MFGIELTFGQKIQAAFIVVVLAIAGILFFRNARSPVNNEVTSWMETRHYGSDPTKRISETNKDDPKRLATTYVFACINGRLKITQYPNDPQGQTKMLFQPSAYQGTGQAAFNYYLDPQERVDKIKDPYKHTLSLAAYSAANKRSLGLLSYAAPTPDQLEVEKKARQAMNDGVTLIDTGATYGTFHADMFKAILKALDTYKALPGESGRINNDDKSYNPKKADAAREVIKLATQYMAKVDEEKSVKVEEYIAAIDNLLTSDQKQKLAEGGTKYMASAAARRGGPAAPPSGLPAGINLNPPPPRGGGPGRGNRGAATGRGGG